MTMQTINPPAIVREVRTLAAIEAEIDQQVGKLKHTKLKLGRLLLEGKEQVEHGQWAEWVETRGIKMRSAQNYMALAKNANLAHLDDDDDPTYAEAGVSVSFQQVDRDAGPELPDGFAPETGNALVGVVTTGNATTHSIFVAESLGHPGYWNAHVVDWRQRSYVDCGSVGGFKRPVRAECLADALSALLQAELLPRDGIRWSVIEGSCVSKVQDNCDQEAQVLRWGESFSWRHGATTDDL